MNRLGNIGAFYAGNRQEEFRMSRKTLAAVVLTNGAATAAATFALVHSWSQALAAGAFSAILARVALALASAPKPAVVRRNDPQCERFAGRHGNRPF